MSPEKAETIGYFEILDEIGQPRERPRLEWPFRTRRTKRISNSETGEIKVLLRHVRDGNMDIESIASAYGVSPDTIKRIRDKKTIPARNVRKNKQT